MNGEEHHNEFKLEGFPGDGEPEIMLSHGKPAYWTRTNTIISAVSILILAIIAAIVFSRMT
ncbi:MAG TPA: hypothetical protein VFJ84_00370 [Candidatus Saccharimonadales bacterium]|nr:hypothetical protein [Candidatus Saccharimonadales bacterium]